MIAYSVLDKNKKTEIKTIVSASQRNRYYIATNDTESSFRSEPI